MLQTLWLYVQVDPGFYILLVICVASFFYGVKVATRWVLEESLLTFLGLTLSVFAAIVLYEIMLNTEADERLAHLLSSWFQTLVDNWSALR